ncbi:MAG: group 1 truncated hemoglobin [Opitutales bacterium]
MESNPTAASTQPLFERLGGEPALNAAVELFYAKMLADERLNRFFQNVPMRRLKEHQAKFLTIAFGGPNNYSGRTMGAAHRRLVNNLGLGDSHFDAVIKHLCETLAELGVQAELITEAALIAESTRDAVLGRIPD